MIQVLEHLSCEESVRLGAVQPGKEKAPGRPDCSLSVLKGGLQESWRGTFYQQGCDSRRDNVFKQKEAHLD